MSETTINPVCEGCGKTIHGNVVWTQDESAFHPVCHPYFSAPGVEDVKAIRAQAYAEGHREGFTKGQLQMRERCVATCQDWCNRHALSMQGDRIAELMGQLEPEELPQ